MTYKIPKQGPGETQTMRISTTIKRKWLDKILSGEKDKEFKGATDYWKPRFDKIIQALRENPEIQVTINFLCGKEAVKFKVDMIVFSDSSKIIDDVQHEGYYSIYIGERLL